MLFRSKRRRLVLRGLDRVEAVQELAEARAELAAQARIQASIGRGRAFASVADYNASADRRQSAGSFADGLGADAFKSPASLERSLATLLRDSAEFTGLLANLRKAGASPWLLEQVVKAGPSKATNRTLRGLLGDASKLARLNAMSRSMVATGNQYAALTGGSGFAASYSGSGAFSPAALALAMSTAQVSLSPESVAAIGDYMISAAATTSGRQLDHRAAEAARAAAFGGAWTGGVS